MSSIEKIRNDDVLQELGQLKNSIDAMQFQLTTLVDRNYEQTRAEFVKNIDLPKKVKVLFEDIKKVERDASSKPTIHTFVNDDKEVVDDLKTLK